MHQTDQPDLTLCDREPIHVPGSIQPHGFLLGLDGSGRVKVASSNPPDSMQRPVGNVFGSTLEDSLGSEAGSSRGELWAVLNEPPPGSARVVRHG